MIIAICNHKGGSGKTTTAVNLGYALSKLNKKVLLVDLDPQGNLSYSLEVNEDTAELSTVFTEGKELSEIMIEKRGITVIPSNMNLSDVEFSLQNFPNREYIISKLLSPYINSFDYILLDCPPSRSLLTINALCVADKVIAPILLDVLSIQGIKHIRRTVAQIKKVFNDKLDFLGILAVNVDERKRLTQQVLEFIQIHFDINVFNNYIRTDVKTAEAPSHGLSVLHYAPKSNSAKDFMSVAQELLTINRDITDTYGIRK